MAPHGTEMGQTIRESHVHCEPSLALDRQMNADHNAHWTPAPTLWNGFHNFEKGNSTSDLPKLAYSLSFSL